MPIYTFFCSGCNQEFEVRQSYDEYGNGNIICPHCNRISETTGGLITRKILISPVIYKGKGFYSNDHKPKEE